MYCIYVAIGQGSTVASIVNTLREYGDGVHNCGSCYNRSAVGTFAFSPFSGAAIDEYSVFSAVIRGGL